MTHPKDFNDLVRDLFGNKTRFAAYVGLRKQTVYGWKTPPLWAMRLLGEMHENRINRQIVESLHELRAAINEALG